MTNYQLNIASPITYTHITINQSPVEQFENYVESLQSSLVSFVQYIEQSLVKVMCYFEDVYRTDYISDLEEVFLLAKENFEIEGFKFQYNIIHKLSEKKVNTANYEKLNRIIEAHQKMAMELIEKEIDTDRIEMISNYLREVIIYLKTDFKVEQLPDLEIDKSKLNFQTQDEEMIIDDYSPTENFEIEVSA